jgi:D-amino-acid oxidase
MTATAFTSVCINTAIYLPWLVSQCLAKGVTFRRAVFSHISEAAAFATPRSSPASLIVNCSGLGAASLGGVLDRTVVPARGQVLLVRNEVTGGNVSGGRMLSFSGTDDGPDEACYIMARAAGGGTILGGCYQKGYSESQPDPNLAVRIMRRAVLACPELVARKKGTGNSDKASAGVEGLDVVRHGVGLRPVREGGTRVEREKIAGVWVVHNYGAGGAGYQSSYGCAMDAVELVDGVLGQTEEKARL